ncbi:YajQ family cyclic di-GMP-binding protein [Candidatus Microgenomates bacterium]|nr:YajQ family cyclic di-GMP-binding protein [Candidatus Microgenomates bacterium]
MADFSFDIVSQFDRQELVNAIDQVKRELSFRYDFKASPYDFILEKESLTVSAEDDYKLKAIQEILRVKLVSRKLDQRILNFTTESEKAAGNTVRQKMPIAMGLKQEKAKEISKFINTSFKKAKVSIQGEDVRVSSTSKDTLQEIITFLKEHDFGIPLQFTNYR